LYYDFDRGVIVDLNPDSQGIKDVKDGPIIRPVGNPYDRFNEDKLRILRLMRFFSRFNPGDITQFLDKQTLEAIQHYQPLYNHGITPERIMDEFFAKGIPSAQDTAQFLQNYANLGLFESVFPGMQVNTQDIARIGNSKNAKVIYAILLRGNGQVLNKLKNLKYPIWMFEGVQFLIDLMSFSFKSQDLVSLIKRKMRLQKMQPSAITDQDLQELMYMSQGLVSPEQIQRIEHLVGYQWQVPGGEELQKQGYKGAEIGARQSELGFQHYGKSWDDYVKAKSPANPTGLDPQRSPLGTQS
jgi:poly(A) polymerase